MCIRDRSETHPDHMGLLAFEEYVESHSDKYDVQIDVYKRQPPHTAPSSNTIQSLG